MATFTGYLQASSLPGPLLANATGLGGKDTNGDPDLWSAIGATIHGSITDTQPTDMPVDAQVGTLQQGFGFLDWYNRIHVQYSLLDMGNLISTQVVAFEIFSTYFVDRTLQGITVTGGDGLLLTPPSALPILFTPWLSQNFELQISTDGPPTIAAAYTFEFDAYEVVNDYPMSIIGRRVIPWFAPPNWQSTVIERIEFRTDILRKFDGSEQRIALRADGAHWSWEFRWNAGGRGMRVLENMLYQWAGRVWAVPIFPQGQALQASLAPGDFVIAVDTPDTDYHADGLAFLHDINVPEVFEAVEIESLDATTITAKRAVQGAWGAGTYIYPARIGRMTKTAPASRFTGAHLYGIASFRLEEQLVLPAATETTYRGYPLQTTKPEWAQDPTVEYARRLAIVDLGIGVPEVDDKSGLSEPVMAFRWAFASRAAVQAFRKWLFARRGRQRAIWLPTFTDDLVVTVAVSAAATNLDVEACGLKNYVAAGVNRRDIRIEMKNGTVYYRRTSAHVEVDPSTERLTIDAALGANYEPEDFAQVSWMQLARLDADATEIAHWTGEVSTSLTVLRAPRTSA